MSAADSLMKRALLWLVVAAFGLGGAIPEGWMPTRAADGDFAISICSGGLTDNEQAAVFAHFQKAFAKTVPSEDAPSPAHDKHKKSPCPFGVLAHAAPLDAASAFIAPPAAQQLAIFDPLLDLAVGRGLAAPPPPARGPPHTA